MYNLFHTANTNRGRGGLAIFGYSIFYLAYAALAGLMMAVQGSVNSMLGKKTGIWQANFIVHLLAVLLLIIILLAKHSSISPAEYRDIPWYYFTGGVMAIIITYGVMISIPELGVAAATTAIVAAQVITAAVIDHFGLFGLEEVSFSWVKFTGILFLSLGVRLLLN